MAEVNDILSEIGKEKSYHYDNGSKHKFTPLVSGEYFGHITDAMSRLVEWSDKKTGNKLKSRVYGKSAEVLTLKGSNSEPINISWTKN